MHAKDLIILEMWNVLSREHFQFTDPTINETTEVNGLNADAELSRTNQCMKKETHHTSENDSKCSPLTPFQLNSPSGRQAKAQELDTKIRNNFQNTYCTHGSSLDIFEHNEVPKESLASNAYEFNPSNERLGQIKNSLLSKSYSMPSLDTSHTEVAPSAYAESNDNVISEGKIIAHLDPIMVDGSYENEEKSEYQGNKVDCKAKNVVSISTKTADDTIITTRVNQGNLVLQPKVDKCDSGAIFHSLDLELNADNKDPAENV